jgi:HK97 family phage major capsid protein
VAWDQLCGCGSEWLAEAAEADDASPALAEPEIPNYKASTFVPFSVELQGDATALLGEVSKLMSDGMTQLLNTAFTTGSGVGNPTGIITALTGGSSVVNTGHGRNPCGKRHLRGPVQSRPAFPGQRPLGG